MTTATAPIKRRQRRPNPDKLTYTVPEAARKLGIGRNQAYVAARVGDIPSIRVGDRILVLKAGLDRLLRVEGE